MNRLVLHLAICSFVAANCPPGDLSDSMYDNDVLRGGQAIVSVDGRNMLLMGADGILQLIGPQGTVWSVNIPNANDRYLILQPDGNLVLFDRPNTSVWATGTNDGVGNGPYHLFLQDDQNLILINGPGGVIWTTETANPSVQGFTRWVCQPCAAGKYSSAFGNLCSDCASGTFSGRHHLRIKRHFSFSFERTAVGVPQ